MDKFFHGTSTASLPSILAQGLIPGAGKGADAWAHKHPDYFDDPSAALQNFEARAQKDPAVFLSSDWRVAADYAAWAAEASESAPVVIEVDLPVKFARRLDYDWADSRGVILRGPIPAKYVHVIYPTEIPRHD